MKITERDKALLVLLVVILIVALAIVLPGVGVMGCRDKLAEYKTETDDLEKDLDAKRDTLRNMGVTTSMENPSGAATALEEKVWDLKAEASHLAGNVMAYAKPYALDESWVDGLEFRYGVKSDEDEKLVEYSPITNVASVDDDVDESFVIGDKSYSLPSSKRNITYTIASNADCTYEVEMTMSEYEAADLGPILLFLHNIASKGSMLITNAAIGGERTVGFTLLMPPKTQDPDGHLVGIAQYAQEIAEKEAKEAEEEGGNPFAGF